MEAAHEYSVTRRMPYSKLLLKVNRQAYAAPSYSAFLKSVPVFQASFRVIQQVECEKRPRRLEGHFDVSPLGCQRPATESKLTLNKP